MFSTAPLLLVAALAGTFYQQFPASAARPYVDAEVRDWRGVTRAPQNVTMPEALRPVVDLMLQRSVTFRQQCSRIQRTPNLVVTLQYGLAFGRFPTGGAVTMVTRRPDGGIDALVHLATLDNQVELIAHEFEHVLEQVDEVDLSAMAARPATGVRLAGVNGQFETDRAIVMGRQVAGEVRNVRR